MTDQKECCPKFNPEPWDEKTITWNDKPFIKDTVTCFMHVPINMGAVIKRMYSKIQGTAAEIEPKDFMILSHDISNWKSDQYIAVAEEVGGAENVKLSGTYLTKVFEGPYKEARNWCAEMEKYVKSQGKEIKNLYFYYTTCPKCAKKWGKNYVVAIAQI